MINTDVSPQDLGFPDDFEWAEFSTGFAWRCENTESHILCNCYRPPEILSMHSPLCGWGIPITGERLLVSRSDNEELLRWLISTYTDLTLGERVGSFPCSIPGLVHDYWTYYRRQEADGFGGFPP